MVVGCSSSGSIASKDPAKISRLDNSFRLFARVGDLPLELDEEKKERILRYALKTPGEPQEYMVVLFPEHVDGVLNLPSQGGKVYYEAGKTNRRYLDLLLRCHRQILRGDLETAADLLDKIDAEFDISYGSLILKGNIAILRGDDEGASKMFNYARRLYPDSKILPE
jgi:hypothetical protein